MMAAHGAIGNTPTMTTSPPPTRYHRWMGWYAPAVRRAVVVSSIGLAVVVVLAWFLPWGLAVVAGWDAAALTFLVEHLADHPPIRRRPRRPAATARTKPAAPRPCCWLGRRGQPAGCRLHPRPRRAPGRSASVLLIGVAVLTVVLSWTVVSTPSTPCAMPTCTTAPGARASRRPGWAEQPTYRDFAYVAFTIGMCYQVSDTTVRDRRIGAPCSPTPSCRICSAW